MGEPQSWHSDSEILGLEPALPYFVTQQLTQSL